MNFPCCLLVLSSLLLDQRFFILCFLILCLLCDKELLFVLLPGCLLLSFDNLLPLGFEARLLAALLLLDLATFAFFLSFLLRNLIFEKSGESLRLLTGLFLLEEKMMNKC